MFSKSKSVLNRVLTRPSAKLVQLGALMASTALVAMPAALMTATPANAITEVVYDAGKSRVNLSSRLVELNQSIAAAACRIGAEIESQKAEKELFKARTEFSEIIKALRESDVSIGVPTPETKSRILEQIWKIEQEWVQVKYAADKILIEDRIPKYVKVIADKNGLLDGYLDDLVSEIVAHYSNPAEMLTGDAFRIRIAARQRYLAKKMSKETCGIASENPEFGAKVDLATTINLFEKSLSALENGMPTAGIAPPPNEWVEGKLTEIRIKWWHAENDAMDAARFARETPRKVEQYADIQNEMDNLVTLYMTSDPEEENRYKAPLTSFAASVLSQWGQEPAIVDAIKAQNVAHANVPQAEIEELDRQWRNQVHKAERPLLDAKTGTELSKWMLQKQIESSGLITEVFVTDNRGVNVAQSQVTSDLWQGDEAKWKAAFSDDPDTPYVTDIAFDQSTGRFQSQVSMSVRDPETLDVIGVITFGINVQAFL